MGGSTVEGMLHGNVSLPSDITVADLSQERLDYFAEKGVCVTSNNKLAVENADVIILAVKPWIVERVVKEIFPSDNKKKQILVSFAAGVTSEQLKGWIGEAAGQEDTSVTNPSIILLIPNIAIAYGSSMSFIAPVNASEEDVNVVNDLFSKMGRTQIVEERLLRAGTTLASCGIAYAMRYIRAAVEGGVEIGFRAKEAEDIVLQTVRGAVDLLQATGMHPEEAIDKVTTPGGVTIRGLNEMEHAGFTSSVIRGLKAGL